MSAHVQQQHTWFYSYHCESEFELNSNCWDRKHNDDINVHFGVGNDNKNYKVIKDFFAIKEVSDQDKFIIIINIIVMSSPRILSIQSHVVSGYCGNKSAIFPLQLLEFETDFINSVHLSNHTQYKTTRGQIFGAKELDDIVIGLKENDLIKLYDNILTGYVASVDYIYSMAKLIEDIKNVRISKDLQCCYTLDPVLGDDETGFYVPNGEKISESYKSNLIPLADIITPNKFEASVLTGVKINSISDAFEAIDVFHQTGISVVCITSFDIFDETNNHVGEKQMNCLMSYKPNANRRAICDDKETQVWRIKFPKLDCPFTGSGDLFAALITAWLRKTNFDFKRSLENTVNTIHDILEETQVHYRMLNNGSAQSYELRLIQNKMKIMCPSYRYKAEKLNL